MSRRIEVREERKDRYCVLRIDPAFDPENKKRGFQPRITAYAEMDFSFESDDYHWKRAEVSWYSCGGVEPEMAGDFGQAILTATEYAKKINAEHGFVELKC